MPVKPALNQVDDSGAKLIVSALIPITLMWKDIMEQHEWKEPSIPIQISGDTLMRFVQMVNDYVASVYQNLKVTQDEWNNLAAEIAPLLKERFGYEQGNDPNGITRVWKDNVGEGASGKGGTGNTNQQGRPKSDDAQQHPLREQGEADTEGEGQSDDPGSPVRV